MATTDAPITPTRSSNEDIEAGIVHSQEEQAKLGNVSVKKEDLPECQDAIPPPPYTDAVTPASPEEQPWGVRAWFNRHRTITGWLLGILSLSILAGLLLGITLAAIFSRCGSDCGTLGGSGGDRQYRSDMCPISREDLLRDVPSSSTSELPKPTGFADGDPNRFLYTNVGGIEPIIGSSFTAISSHFSGERIFYHDARGQIYESFYGPKTSGYYQRDREWGVFKVPDAILAVNTSLAAVSIDTGFGLEDYHNTTVLYYHPANDTRIARILTRSPGNYQGPDLSPFRTYSNFLAATAVDLRILLAYREEDYTAVGDGWWGEPDQSDAARHASNIHFPDAAPESHLSIAPVASTFWAEGFVLAYQPSNTDKLETTLHYVMIAKDNLSMAFSDSSPYYGKADQPMALHNATYTISHYGSSRPSVEIMPSNNNIGADAFAVSQFRAGNLTYEAFTPQLQGSSSRGGVVIKPRPISRYAKAQGYYCTYGDQPILNVTALNDRTPPLYDFIPWSPIVGVGSGGRSKIYLVRQSQDETQGAILASFKHSSNQTPPELDLTVPLFARPGGGLNDSSVDSLPSKVMASSTTEPTTVLETATESYDYTTPPTPLPKNL